ncbi:DUF732 domain-containing protein [Mycobacterium sp. C31M]
MVVIGVVCAAPAQADVDTDFARTLHGYGIYGPRDYNAWLGKLSCKRLSVGLDADAGQSAVFLSNNLARTTNTEQVWQFLGAPISVYCPQYQTALTAFSGAHA